MSNSMMQQDQFQSDFMGTGGTVRYRTDSAANKPGFGIKNPNGRNRSLLPALGGHNETFTNNYKSYNGLDP